MAKRRYRIETVPGMSDQEDTSYLKIKGPNVDTFEVMERIARLLETMLNATSDYAKD